MAVGDVVHTQDAEFEVAWDGTTDLLPERPSWPSAWNREVGFPLDRVGARTVAKAPEADAAARMTPSQRRRLERLSRHMVIWYREGE